MTTATRPQPTHWYVRTLDRIGGLTAARQLDEGEQRTALESAAIGHVLAQFGSYLAAIAMAWLGSRSVVAWSFLLLVIPAVSQTLSGLYGWVKRKQMGTARLSTRSQMVDGIPVVVLCMVWMAGFLVRAIDASVAFRVGVAVFTLVLMVVLGFVFIKLGQQEQARADRSLEDDDEF